MRTHRIIVAASVIISLSACVTRTVYVTQPPPSDQAAYTPVTPPPTNYQQPQQQPVTPPPSNYQQPAYQQPVTPPPSNYQQPTYQQPYQQQQPVGYDQFYNELSPYGQWVNYGNYGYVWIPFAGSDFVPYSTAGHWEYTSYGWMWVSEYQWGWAPFHYGRWEYDAYYGWFWIPGNEWSPAWVSWRSCDGYYGWAPLGYGHDYNYYDMPEDHWVFVNAYYINDPYIYRHYEGRDHDHDYYRRSNSINRNYYDNDSRSTYNTGPEPTEVSRYTGSVVTPVPVHQASKPGEVYGNHGEVEVYRPQVTKPATNTTTPPPRNVVDIKQVTPVTQRNVMTKPTVTPYQRQVVPTNAPKTAPPANTTQQPQMNTTQPVQPRTLPPANNTTQPQMNTTQPVQPRTMPPANNTTQPQMNTTQPVQQKTTEPVNRQQPQQTTQPVQQQTTQPTQQRSTPPSNNNKQPKSQQQPKPVKQTPTQVKPVEDKK